MARGAVVAEPVKQEKQPPRLAQRILSLSIPISIREQLIGDLIEEYYIFQAPERGTVAADLWFWKQTILSTYEYLNKQQGGIIMFTISLFIFVAIIALAMVMGGELGIFIDIPILLITLLPAIAFAIASTGKNTIKASFKYLFSEQSHPGEASVKNAIRFWTVFGNTSVLMGWILFFIALASIGSTLFTDPTHHHVIASSGFVTKSLMYASIAKLLGYVCSQRIERLFSGDNT